jgi:hypothetical protein
MNPVVVPDETVGLSGVPVKGFPDGVVVGVPRRVPVGVQEDHIGLFIARQAVEPKGVIPVMIRDEEGYAPPFRVLCSGALRGRGAGPEKQKEGKPSGVHVQRPDFLPSPIRIIKL